MSGERGEQGTAGKAGAAGETGAAGRTGEAGAAGRAGRAGDAGHAGATGDQGEKGYRGAQGYPGNQGNQGFTGEGGIVGPAGEQGATGRPGIDAVLIGRRALTIVISLLVLFVGGVGAVLSIAAIDNSTEIGEIERVRGAVIARVQETSRLNCEANNVLRRINRGVFEQRLKDDPGPPALEKELRGAVRDLEDLKCTTLPVFEPEVEEGR